MKHLKKYMIVSLFLLSALLVHSPTAYAQDQLNTLLTDQAQGLAQDALPTASLIIDAEHGQVLWEEESETLIDPGFLTNLMTLYLTYEALAEGQIALTDTMTVSDKHQLVAQIPYLPSNNLMTGSTYTVEELIKLVSFSNAVGGSFLLADRLSENTEAFVTRMNDKAKDLGLTQTTFTNPSGLSLENTQGYESWLPITLTGNNQSTARDLALLTYHLTKNYPALLELTSQPEMVLQNETLNQEVFYNKNPFLYGAESSIKGTNGLLIDDAQSVHTSVVLTTKQDGLSLITILLGVNQNFFTEEGNYALPTIGQTLVNNAFETYEYRSLLLPETLEVDGKEIVIEQELKGAIARGTEASFTIEGERLLVNNSLPFVSSTLEKNFQINYQEGKAPLEEQLGENVLVRLIMDSVEITKLTIFSLGIIPMGILIFLMHFFIPKKKEKAVEEVSESRKSRHSLPGSPFRAITFYLGLLLSFSGVILLVLQYIF